jgi:hypothetical protein
MLAKSFVKEGHRSVVIEVGAFFGAPFWSFRNTKATNVMFLCHFFCFYVNILDAAVQPKPFSIYCRINTLLIEF